MSSYICATCDATSEQADPLCTPRETLDPVRARAPETPDLDAACHLMSEWTSWRCSGCGRATTDPAQVCEPRFDPAAV